MAPATLAGATLYTDPLVDVTDEGVRIKCYYLTGGDKTVRWDEIESVTALAPGLRTGKWRLWGTGGLSIWFACDFDRPVRQTIFIMKLRTQRVRAGFTVHDAGRVKELLASRGVLDDRQGATPPARPIVRSPSIGQSVTLWLMLAVFLLLVADAMWHYPHLPETVATHFNATGAADGFGSKRVLAIATVGSGLGITVLFSAIALATSRSASAISGRHLLGFGLGTLLLVGAISHLTYRANVTGTMTMGTAPWYLLAGYLLWAIVWIGLLLRKLARI